jgi:hypothetical protein
MMLPVYPLSQGMVCSAGSQADHGVYGMHFEFVFAAEHVRGTRPNCSNCSVQPCGTLYVIHSFSGYRQA